MQPTTAFQPRQQRFVRNIAQGPSLFSLKGQTMAKRGRSFRLSDETYRQLADLAEHFGTTQTDILTIATDRMYQQEKENISNDITFTVYESEYAIQEWLADSDTGECDEEDLDAFYATLKAGMLLRLQGLGVTDIEFKHSLEPRIVMGGSITGSGSALLEAETDEEFDNALGEGWQESLDDYDRLVEKAREAYKATLEVMDRDRSWCPSSDEYQSISPIRKALVSRRAKRERE